MCVIATELSEEEISEMVEYYRSKKFTAGKQEFDAAKAAFQEVSQAR
jgi:cytochrome c553